jgi:hypothetical protein
MKARADPRTGQRMGKSLCPAGDVCVNQPSLIALLCFLGLIFFHPGDKFAPGESDGASGQFVVGDQTLAHPFLDRAGLDSQKFGGAFLVKNLFIHARELTVYG